MGLVAACPGAPGALAISDDGHYLYAALVNASEVVRLDLTAAAPDLRFSLAIPGDIWKANPSSMLVVPRAPETLIVSILRLAMVFDRGQPRPQIIPSDQIVQGADSTTLFQTYMDYARGVFQMVKLNEAGLEVVQETTLAFPPRSATGLTWQPAFVLFDSGYMMDPRNGDVLGQFPIAGPMLPQSTERRVLFSSTSSQPWAFPGATLHAFSSDTFREIWQVTIPEIVNSSAKLIEAGVDRVAFIAGNQLAIVNLNSISAFPAADLSLTLTSTQTGATLGGHYTCQLVVQNFGPWTAQNVRVTVPIPAGLTFESATASQGQARLYKGNLVVGFGELVSNGQATVNVTLAATTMGAKILTANLAPTIESTADPVPEDNAAAALRFTVAPGP